MVTGEGDDAEGVVDQAVQVGRLANATEPWAPDAGHEDEQIMAGGGVVARHEDGIAHLIRGRRPRRRGAEVRQGGGGMAQISSDLVSWESGGGTGLKSAMSYMYMTWNMHQ